MEIVRDLYLNKLRRKKHNGLIKVITGVRRCGKSYLLTKLFHKQLKADGVKDSHIIEIALDDRANARLLDPDTLLLELRGKIIDSGTYYIVLDEIQLVREFETVLNSLLHIQNADVYVTGSNSRFLSSDIITEFRGRGDEVRVHPLTFAEFYSARGGEKYTALEEYFKYGGLPFILSCQTEEDKQEYLSSQFAKVYLNDIIDRHRVKNKAELDELTEIIASCIGSPTNPLKISNTFKGYKGIVISHKTVSRYLDYLEDAFLISKAKRFDVRGRRYINTPVKYYFEDLGLRNAKTGFRQIELPHLMENAIYNELRCRGYCVDTGNIETFAKDARNNKTEKKQLEIDFVANMGGNVCYIQSAFQLATEEKRVQEMRPFKYLDDSFKKMLITADPFGARRDGQGIYTTGIFDFLLNPDSI